MPGLAEGVSARVAYKFYTDADITPGVAADSESDLGRSGGQILRRVGSTLQLEKQTYQSNEVRLDKQVSDFRHGPRRAPGAISGELSNLTYEQWFEASLRGTWAAAITGGNADFTSVAADNATSKFTFASGNPVTQGFRVGMGVRFSSLSEAGNNSKNFIILSFGGTQNREVTVFPAPTDMGADTSFSVTSVGRSLIIPASSHVKRKLAIEHYHEDKEVAELFVEGRVGGFTIDVPATGIPTIEFMALCRDLETYEGTDSPFFTGPAAATTTRLLSSKNGLLRIGGSTVAVVTGVNIQHAMELTGDPVVGSDLMPDVLAGRSIVSGQMTAFFENLDLIDDFRNENEIELLAFLKATTADDSPAMTFYLPRIKLGGAQKPLQGEGAQSITLPFQALKYEDVAAATGGIENTTLQVWDTEVTS